MSLAALLALAAAHPAFAQFSPGPNPITGTVGTQSLTGGTGTVNSGGSISTSGSTVGVNVTGTSTINNNGTIQQTGSGRAIDANTGGITLTLVNSGTISSVGGNETIRMAQTATLLLNNQLGGVISSLAADAIRPGNNSIINNAGTISATPPNVASPAGSDGIDLRTQRTGITINNSGTISGRHGIATDGANTGPSSVTVTNLNGGTIFALNGSGLNVDGVSTTATANVTNFFGATIKGGVYSAATEGDGDGIDVDGVLTLNNSGNVLGLGAKGGTNNAEGIAAGGGSITNSATGRIIGSTLLVEAPNGDASRAGNGILIDDSNGGNAVAATTVTNSGLIQGKSGFGIRMIGTFDDTVINNAGGTIRGTGSSTVVDTGDGSDYVVNQGTIQHDTLGTAVSLGAGNDAFYYTSGTITGAISGGTGSNLLDLGAGLSHSYATQDFPIVNVATGTATLAGTVSGTTLTKSGAGTLDLTAANTLTGTTTVAAGTLKVNNLTGSATGTGAVNVNTGTTLGGGGLIGGLLTLNGILAPGNSIGTLTVNNDVVWNGSAGNAWAFELGAANTSDRLVLSGDFLKGLGSTFAFDFQNSAATGTFVLADWGGITNFSAGNFSYTNLGAGNSGLFSFNGSQLEFVAIPEPSTYAALLGLGMLGFVLWRRNRPLAAASSDQA